LAGLANKIFARESGKQAGGYPPGEVLLIVTDALDRICHICVQKESIVESSFNKFIAGHTSIVSVYFAERFYRKGLNMKELTLLIAHTILDAGRAKDSGVEGLEILSDHPKPAIYDHLKTGHMETYSGTLTAA
jgi:hypothetical protein